MKQSKLAGLVLLGLGILLLVFGFNASESPFEEIIEAVTGRYSPRGTRALPRRPVVYRPAGQHPARSGNQRLQDWIPGMSGKFPLS